MSALLAVFAAAVIARALATWKLSTRRAAGAAKSAGPAATRADSALAA
ncbi:hypothetical protein [Embleya sp. NBC_00896]|nr:hypothetical protein OG928_12710 [Embleya sp. NBC_00896]